MTVRVRVSAERRADFASFGCQRVPEALLVFARLSCIAAASMGWAVFFILAIGVAIIVAVICSRQNA
jgi:hypothetical protein